MDQPAHGSGWEYVAESDAVASVIDVALAVPSSEPFTQSELAGRANVPLKRLYLEETVQTLETVGVFETIDAESEGETRYIVNEDSEVLAAAERFDRTFAEKLGDE